MVETSFCQHFEPHNEVLICRHPSIPPLQASPEQELPQKRIFSRDTGDESCFPLVPPAPWGLRCPSKEGPGRAGELQPGGLRAATASQPVQRPHERGPSTAQGLGSWGGTWRELWDVAERLGKSWKLMGVCYLTPREHKCKICSMLAILSLILLVFSLFTPYEFKQFLF